MLHYLNAQSLSRDSIVRLGSLHQKIFPFSPRPQSDCLQQSFTIRHHISSVIMEQHFHTYSFVTLIVLWLPETLTLISKCIVKNQLPRHAAIHVPATPRRRQESFMFSHDDHSFMDSGLTTSHM